MALRPWGLFQEIRNSVLSVVQVSLLVTYLAFILLFAIVQGVNRANTRNQRNTLDSSTLPSSPTGVLSSWLNCPQGWTLIYNRCYKLTDVPLTWQQAQVVCSSYGGNIVSINSQSDQVLINEFVSSFQEDGIWIGLARYENQSYQWAEGQPAVELDGFWSINGLKAAYDDPSVKLCCQMKSASPGNSDLRWVLTECDELHVSLCMVEPCEQHAMCCADGRKCVSKVWMCDKHWDCDDGSDEFNCSYEISTSALSHSQHCGATLKRVTGALQSPNYPEKYPAFADCVWKIEILPPKVIELKVESLQIETLYDWLKIYDGVEMTDETLLEYFDESVSDLTVVSTGSFVYVHFVSDHSIEAQGFNITWKSVDYNTISCGGHLKAGQSEKYIHFPSSNSKVMRQKTCDWLISATQSDVLHLQFHPSLSLYGKDSITIYDGQNTKSDVITYINSTDVVLVPDESQPYNDVALFQYVNIPPVIVSSDQYLYVHVSLGSGSQGPFLSYKDGCEVQIASDFSFILSPGFVSSKYSNNLKCTWTIPKHSSGKNQTLFFLPGFQTEFNKDFVQVQTSSHLVNFSGSSAVPPSVISSNYEFCISFHSDSTVNRGRWGAIISLDCDPLHELPPLMVNTSKSIFGATVQFSCPPDSKLVGSSYAICINGSWLIEEPPKCEKLNCGSAPVPPEMYLAEMTGTTIGSTAKYSCLQGYRMLCSDTAICGYNGWELVPSCEVITCPKEPPPRWGTGLAEEITFGYVRKYYCNDGFQMIGVKYSHCNSSGHWSDPVPVCRALSCPKLLNISHGYFNVTGEPVPVGASVQIICDAGYKANAPDIITCLPSLLYDQIIPVCIDKDECYDDNSICGNHVCQNLPGDYACLCGKGYAQQTGTRHGCIDVNECENNNGECSDLCTNTEGGYNCSCPSDFSLYDGPWDRREHQILVPYQTCFASCAPLNLTNQAAVLYNQRKLYNGKFLNGTEAYVKCPIGYFPISSTLTCLSGTGWSEPLPTCKLSECENLRDINNGSVVYSSLTLGSKAIYSCNQGFLLQYINVRFCMEHANESLPSKRFGWSGSEPSCILVTCPPLEPPLNGTVNLSAYTYNSVALFRCQCGFSLVGQSILRCRGDGQWSAPSPTCAVESCSSPGKTNATVFQYYPGFPLGSTVYFQCDAPGYNLSGHNSLVCSPISISKKSALQPSMKLTVSMEFQILNNSSLVSACLMSYSEKMRVVLRHRLRALIVNAFNHDVQVNLHSDYGKFYDHILRISVITSSVNVSASYYHGQLIREAINSSLTLEDFDREFADEPISCPSLRVKPDTELSPVAVFECMPGLRLQNESNGDTFLPVCMEDCLFEGSLSSPEASTEIPADWIASVPADGHSGVTTSDITSPHTPQFDPDISDSATATKFTATPAPITTHHITSTKSTNVLTTARKPSSKSLEFNNPENEKGNILNFTKLEGPDAEFFGTTSITDKLWKEDITSRSSQSSPRNEQQDTNVNKNFSNISCTNVDLNQNPGNNSDGSSTPRLDMDVNGKRNVSECSTTHSLEKQEVTMVHQAQSTLLNFTTPVYSVEMTDSMTGVFTNVSCIDAVHVSINTKVNELLREFGNKMGKQVCVFASDASLELTAGNIRFKGSTARTNVQFSFGYVTSIKPSVESCANEFKEYTYEELPKKFERVQQEVVHLGCEIANYTRDEFVLTLSGWSCHAGYVFDLTTFQCVYKTSESGRVSLTPVMTVPRLMVPFTANFTFHQAPSAIEAHCISEYSKGLERVLSELEPTVQPGLTQCPGVYITLTKSITVKLVGNSVSVKIMVHLLPVQEGISKSMMQQCGRFISAEFQKPSHKLASLSLSKETLPQCPLIKMAGNGLEGSEKTRFFCLPAYHYDNFNFLCIDDNLSFYASNISMTLQGAVDGELCDNAVRDSVEQMANTVIVGLQGTLSHEVCKGTKSVYILHEQGTVSIEKLKSQILVYMPLTLISLTGSKANCEECTEQLFLHLRSALPQPSNTMAKNISDHCRSEVSSPGEYIVLNKEWKCFHGYSYNVNTHKCDPIGPLETDEDLAHGHSISHRHKRDAVSSVSWQNEAPICIDVQPPVFIDCPTEAVNVVLNNFISHPWNITKPTAIDNSGQEPHIYLMPSAFIWPSSFQQVQAVTITAEDASGNKAICNITVNIVDEEPPTFGCPKSSTLAIDTNETWTKMTYKNTQFLVGDNQSNVTLLFDPPENTLVPVLQTFVVSVKAIDASNNSRTCHFNFTMEPKGCPEWSLQTPVGANKTCVKTGSNNEGLVCNLTCLSNGVSEQIVCVSNANWSKTTLNCPITVILGDCPPGTFKYSSICKECPKGTYQNGSDPSSCISCPAGFSTITTGAKQEDQCLALCDLNKYSNTGLQPCTTCPVGFYQEKQGSTSCDPCISGRNKSKHCLDECEPGHYSSNGLVPCKPCPHNYYTALYKSITCRLCPSNKITLSVGSSLQSQCTVPTDPCQGNPCKNLGTCVSNGRNFTCDCMPGFSGPTCLNKTDPCNCVINRTCLNQGNTIQYNLGPICLNKTNSCQKDTCGLNGLCENTTTGFRCQCSNGFKGESCEVREISPCHCENDGICLNKDTISHCFCPEGFSGEYCEIDIDECANNPCLNGATCIDGINQMSCACPNGFTGEFCEENIDDCASSPCENNGFCQDEVGTYSCQCPFGHFGVSCENEENPCDSEPCMNGGQCQGSQDIWHCQCSIGYTGERCETKIDNCEPMPCSITGTESCEEDIAGTFLCNCLPGWKGQVCNVSVDACDSEQCSNIAINDPNKIVADICSSDPCQNAGTCNLFGDSFVCNCLIGFTGAICETNIDECRIQPCKNRGICKDGVNAFFCQCPVGFAGEICEVDIDECVSLPCQNNGTCISLRGNHQCICKQGFSGEKCELEINECESTNPCLNGGRCSDKISGFMCSCESGFTGAQCETSVDLCKDRSRCLNGASCKSVNSKDVCVCTPYYTGLDCGKEKSSNYDLYFNGDSYASVQPPLLNVANMSELSICLWSKVHSESTYLSLRSGEEIVFALRQSEAMSTNFMKNSVKLPTNDGLWHFICWIWNTTYWTVYFDGVTAQVGDLNNTLIKDSLELKLGQQTTSSDEEWFKGHLSSLNIYSFAMTQDQVLNLSSSCQQTQGGDVFDWVLASNYIYGDGEIVAPSQCQQIVCTAGLCGSAINGADKIPPTVVICPESQVVTGDKSSAPVTWDEPVFTDNVGITLVIQNFRSGHYFSYGHYVVSYFAFDSNNNSARCSFDIFFRRFECVDPPPPVGGSRVCGDWKHGRYCVPSCMNKFQFVTQVPKFYRCGQEGVWDPPTAFPVCASYSNPNYSILGSVTFEGPSCSEGFKTNLQEKLLTVLNKVEACSSVCNHTQNLLILCNNHVMIRKRRSLDEIKAQYNVTLEINLLPDVNQYQPGISLNTIQDEIVQSIKNNVQSQFTLTSVDLHLLPLCQIGQTLQDQTCVDCLAGHYVTQDQICKPCARDWYNEKPLQTECQKCPEGKTTQNEGAVSSSQCVSVCDVGSYFNVETSECEQCPLAQYQDKQGEWECRPCPSGLTTKSMGAKSVKDCQALCAAGSEVAEDGQCRACLIGTFRSDNTGLHCTPCLAGWNTQGVGSISESQCNVAKCLKGYFKNVVDGTCHPCPVGTFQPNAEETTCLPCGINLTTEKEGAHSKLLCVAGRVNECELKIATCNINEICRDQDNGYTCECKLGVTTAGKCIDVCEHFCNETKSCNNKEVFPDCFCKVELCKGNPIDDEQTQNLLIASMSLTALALVILLIVIAVCIHRKNQSLKEKKRIRIYREEIERTAFTNEAFDSFPTGTSLTGSEIPLYHVPIRVATRWHNRYFVSDNSSSDIESTDF